MPDNNGQELRWIPLSGNWSFQGTNAEYNGPDDPQTPASVTLSSTRIRNGRISTNIRISEPERGNAGRIVLGYNAATENYYSVGLGGYGHAYLIDEFTKGQGWRAVSAKGITSHLKRQNLYKVDVDIRGQMVFLSVDGIEVIAQQLPHPLEGGQVGLFAWGSGSVQFEGFDWSVSDDDLPRVFVVMEFDTRYDSLYSEVIKPVCKEYGFEAYRADDVYRPGIILQDIISGLKESDMIIAEISPTNPNVFYELGYAHAIEKPTVLLARRGGELPFDISGYRVIFYDDTIGGKSAVEKDLKNHLSNITGSTRANYDAV